MFRLSFFKRPVTNGSKLLINTNTLKCAFSYSTAASEAKKSSRKIDSSMLKPLFYVILVVSALNKVSEQQKQNAELERRYRMKLQILQDLITRLEKNRKVDFDINQELKLVHKLFDKYDNKYDDTSIIKHNYTEKEIVDSLNGINNRDYNNKTDDDEDLNKLFNDILKDMDKDPEQIKRENIEKEIEFKENDVNQDGIIVNKALLEAEKQKEKSTWTDYKADIDQHIVVEKAGDFATAAEDTKVSKFL
ncbi:uncharacterized protein SCODWIG_01626 [Saccharomycodes ludwigii]|uniref:Uncharacterized protein n=1 Tax=Saccharomycodes ludwigii TaxID=36035 RepID=A0A376B5A5_9ASCO|nr:hypothetical protein SCDLUD_003081 [Saccharomycodes ludwigii]KAH3900114.1 hypothetical protein SCDLUD_003081 [Saccharomycodes ludwigii]SSD59865.1 uncharacterized protein SCODWIG_01626 [Saccharomycodes ludwigii]